MHLLSKGTALGLNWKNTLVINVFTNDTSYSSLAQILGPKKLKIESLNFISVRILAHSEMEQVVIVHYLGTRYICSQYELVLLLTAAKIESRKKTESKHTYT